MTLPKEISESISKDAEASANRQDFHYPCDNWSITEVAERQHIAGYELGATEWALMANEAQRENEQLKSWKAQATELLNPILDYADNNLNVPLGKSKTEALINFIEGMVKALEEIQWLCPDDTIKGTLDRMLKARKTAANALADYRGKKEGGDE